MEKQVYDKKIVDLHAYIMNSYVAYEVLKEFLFWIDNYALYRTDGGKEKSKNLLSQLKKTNITKTLDELIDRSEEILI